MAGSTPDAAHWQRVRRLLESALELPPDEQRAFVDKACGDDPALKSELESLIQHGEAPDFLSEGAAWDASDALLLLRTTNLEGERLGAWRIEQRIAKGGMGAVYLASRDDGEFKKTVAIKVVRQRMATDAALRRFRAERQILADIDHPNIARLLDAGRTEEGLPYLVMEYVEGKRIDRYCGENNLPISERLELFRQVCAAVQVAHDRQIVHRDIKPSNLLVMADGTPKLLDFGIAKMLAPELMDQSVEETARFQRLMTPAYASPEQVTGDAVTAASDVYSLGVVLYRLLTGQHPYAVDDQSPEEVERIVCEVEPTPPSQAVDEPGLRGVLEGELDAIVLKALAKRPAHRYASASALSDAIEDAKTPSGPMPLPAAPAERAPATSDVTAAAPETGPEEEPIPSEAPLTWGSLEIIRKLGEGVFGDVYMARDPSLDRVVALKLFSGEEEGGGISAQVTRRILKEGQLLARVRHPNVVEVYGAAVYDDTVGLWMEHIHGSTLADLLKRQGRFGAREASLIGVDLCAALAAVHGKGVVHRDIKAQNVIREEGGRIVLMDFGAGRDLVGATSRGDPHAVGTPLYMAAEVLRGEPATLRSDLYSLGVLLCHLVTGSFPMTATSVAELVEKHESGERPLLRDLRSDLPPRFARVVEKALATDPADRFASAGEMQHALEVAADLSTDQSALVTPIPEARETETPEHRTIRRMVRVLNWIKIGLAGLAYLTFIGLLNSFLERLSMQVPARFEEPSLLGYLLIGIRADIPVVIAAVLVAVILGVLLGVAVLVLKAVGKLDDVAQSIRQSVRSANPEVVVGTLLLFSIVGIAAALFIHRDLWQAIMVLEDNDAIRTADLSRLGDYPAQRAYEWTFASLVVANSIAAAAGFGVARRNGGRTPLVGLMRVGLIGTIVVAAVLFAMPWKLLVDEYDRFDVPNRDSEFWEQPDHADLRWGELDEEQLDHLAQLGEESVNLYGKRGYVIAQTATEWWLYFPEIRLGLSRPILDAASLETRGQIFLDDR